MDPLGRISDPRRDRLFRDLQDRRYSDTRPDPLRAVLRTALSILVVGAVIALVVYAMMSTL